MSNSDTSIWKEWEKILNESYGDKVESIKTWRSSGLEGPILYSANASSPEIPFKFSVPQKFQLISKKSDEIILEDNIATSLEIDIESNEILPACKVATYYALPTTNYIEWNEKLNQHTTLISGFDPWSWSLLSGKLNANLNTVWANIASRADEYYQKKYIPIRLSSWPYASAGGTVAEELALAVSECIQITADLMAEGLKPDQISHLICFELSVGTDIFIEIAKVISFRHLIESVWREFGITSSEVKVFLRGDLKNFSARDNWNNLMRISLQSMGALLSGADGVRLYPFDVFNKVKHSYSEDSFKNAILSHLKESNIKADKGLINGNDYIQDLVLKTSQGAWRIVQEIESKGGFVEALKSGWVQSFFDREETVPNLVGLNEYIIKGNDLKTFSPLKKVEVRLMSSLLPAVDYNSRWLDVKPIQYKCYSEIFETEQFMSDEFFYKNSMPKNVYLLQDGDRVPQRPRWNWFKHFFEKKAVTVKPLGINDDCPEQISELYVLADDPKSPLIKSWLEKNINQEVAVYWVGKLANKDESYFKSDFYEGKTEMDNL